MKNLRMDLASLALPTAAGKLPIVFQQGAARCALLLVGRTFPA